MMTSYEVRKIGQNKGAPRIWLEGAQPERAGFKPGSRYEAKTDKDKQMVVLELVESGLRIVSRKTRGEREVPVIDLNSAELLSMFEGYTMVRIVMREGRIFILPSATEVKKRERLSRLEAKLAAGEPILTGSLSHGGGVLDHALHKGMDEEGLASRLAFANDIRPELLEQACEHNDAWDEHTQFLAAPMQELMFDGFAVSKLPKVEVLAAGIPCSGASVAGRAKRGLALPEDHPEVGHLVVSFLVAVAATQPIAVLIENVVPYAGSASMSIIRNQLRDMGYVLHERQLEGQHFNAIEHRKRMCMVAVTEGVEFDFEQLEMPVMIERKLSEILEDLPDDDPRWSEMVGLKAKQERDIAAQKGFRMQVVTGENTKIPTLTKDLQKNRSTDPKVGHTRNPNLLRVPTPLEHARAKGVPEKLITGLCATTAHELLGQSVIYAPFVAVGKLIAKALRGEIIPRVVAAIENVASVTPSEQGEAVAVPQLDLL